MKASLFKKNNNGENYHTLVTGDMIVGYTENTNECSMNFPGMESCRAIFTVIFYKDEHGDEKKQPFWFGHHAPPGSYSDVVEPGDIYVKSETDESYVGRIMDIVWKSEVRIEIYGTSVGHCSEELEYIKQKILATAEDPVIEWTSKVTINTHSLDILALGFKRPSFLQETVWIPGKSVEDKSDLFKVSYTDSTIVITQKDLTRVVLM